MPSIAQAQAKLLGGDFLDTLGDEQTATPKLNTVEAMLALYAEEFVNKAKDNLNADNSVNSAFLRDSIRFETTTFGRLFKVTLYVADYFDYINQGVKGVKGSQNTPYKFKGLWVSKSHRDAIEKWIVRNRLTANSKDVKKYGATKRESKAIPYGDKGRRQLAYLIARSIKRKGITGTGFWTKAFDSTFADFGQQMSKALGEDIKIDLRNMVKRIKKK